MFADEFQKIWPKEYISSLITRSKWENTTCKISEGDVVRRCGYIGKQKHPEMHDNRGKNKKNTQVKTSKLEVNKIILAIHFYFEYFTIKLEKY